MCIATTLKDLDKAYKNFFRRIKQGQQTGFPKFKSKKSSRHSYRCTNTNSSIEVLDTKYLKFPKLGKVRCKFSRVVEGRILNATISKTIWKIFCVYFVVPILIFGQKN